MIDVMEGKMLTIFTPTYNREKTLERLYKSLTQQTSMQFEWLIVDDGSTDETAALIANLKEYSPFVIRYYKQENHGKHVAHNRGAKEAKGDLFLCVDSDDWLEKDAVETIIKDAEGIDNNEGLIYPRLYRGQLHVKSWFSHENDDIALSDMRMKYGLVIETAIVFRTNILREHPFPVFENEKYLPEGASYYTYKEPELFKVKNNAFYRSEYLDSGLTKNIYKNWKENPRGTKYALNERYKSSLRYHGFNAFKNRVASLSDIIAINFAIEAPMFKSVDTKSFLKYISVPIAWLLYRKKF